MTRLNCFCFYINNKNNLDIALSRKWANEIEIFITFRYCIESENKKNKCFSNQFLHTRTQYFTPYKK